MSRVGFVLILAGSAVLVTGVLNMPIVAWNPRSAPGGIDQSSIVSISPFSPESIVLVYPDRIHFGIDNEPSDTSRTIAPITATFRNVSERHVRIVSARAGCGCIKVTVAERDYGPGEEFPVTFALDSNLAQSWRGTYGVVIRSSGGADAWRGSVSYERSSERNRKGAAHHGREPSSALPTKAD